MAIKRTLARITLRSTTGLPRDNTVNDLAFAVDDTVPGINGLLTGSIVGFYTTAPAGSPSGRRISDYLSDQLDRTVTVPHKVDLIDIDDPTPRIPYYTAYFNMPAAAGGLSKIPAEVALCMSFGTSPPGGVNPQSTHGRIYLGPLNNQANDSGSVDNRPRPVNNLLTTVGLAAAEFLMDPAPDFVWSVWSRTLDTLFPVTAGYLDNEFDTMRSRGGRATVRIPF